MIWTKSIICHSGLIWVSFTSFATTGECFDTARLWQKIMIKVNIVIINDFTLVPWTGQTHFKDIFCISFRFFPHSPLIKEPQWMASHHWSSSASCFLVCPSSPAPIAFYLSLLIFRTRTSLIHFSSACSVLQCALIHAHSYTNSYSHTMWHKDTFYSALVLMLFLPEQTEK